MIDLHIHSEHSDGTYSVEKIFKTSKNLGIHTISITDHDSINSQKEAIYYANKYNLRYITGVEFSIDYRNPNGAFHLLGYGIDIENKNILQICDRVIADRILRNKEILKLLNSAGYKIEQKELEEKFNTNSPGRPHIASLMKEKGYVKSIFEAFEKYLGDHKEFYVEKKSINLRDACDAIIGAGGIPIIAHPLSLRLNKDDFAVFLKDAHYKGVVGIEAFNSGFKNRNCRKFLKANNEILTKTEMIYTAGSDFHGSNKPGIKMGRDSAGRKISGEFLPQKIKNKIIRLE